MSILQSLALRHFRNYKEATALFSPGTNLIRGENAQGKTNLLEAIYLLSIGRSFRTQKLSELIREGESLFYLEAHLLQNRVEQTVAISFDGKAKNLQYNANIYSSFAPLLGNLPFILHTPADIDLIDGSPALRRRLLNLHLAQSDPLYVHHLTRFWRAMKQRHAVLRASLDDPSLICWEIQMAQSAQYLWEARERLIGQIRPPLMAHGKDLSGGTELHDLIYHPSKSSDYIDQLQKNRRKDRDLKMTLIGPHRDEISFSVEGKLAKSFASEGQKKTSIAALRLAQWDALSAHFDAPAVIAIDDVGLPLDTARQKRFHEKLSRLGQVFMTTPDTHLPFSCHVLEIRNGCIEI